MNIITYLKDTNPIKLVLAIITLVFGLYSLFFFGRISAILYLFFAFYLFLREGSEIDLDNKMYRTIYSFWGLKMGQWKPIPKFEYVSVFNTSETQQVNVITASARFKSPVIVLNLFYDRNKHVTFYKTKDKADAFKVAKHFQLALDIDILDATEREKKWL